MKHSCVKKTRAFTSVLAFLLLAGCGAVELQPELSTQTTPSGETATTEALPPQQDPHDEPPTLPTVPPETTTPAAAPTLPLPTEAVTEPPPATLPTAPTPTEPPETQPATVTPESSFAIHFIDVGQADAALVLCDGMSMLIDGGNAEDSSLMYTYLKKLGITKLDYVIGTHAHEDHIGGIAGALNYASVDKVYCPVTSYSSKAFNSFVKAVRKHGSSITVPDPGDRFSLGSANCQILGVNSTDDTNNSSIVLRITYGNTSFLFTGDAEREAENIILDRGYDISCDVLKVGHHGSSTSTSYLWLRQAAPRYAVISVGKNNSYGHPTEEVLSRLRDADVKTYRTDLQGDIICTSDGQNVRFQVSRNEDADTFGGIGGNSTQTTQPSGDTQSRHYVLNTNSMKFHDPDCPSTKRISDKNRKDYQGTRDELLDQGYDPCGNCDP